jgi:hypothetical protein
VSICPKCGDEKDPGEFDFIDRETEKRASWCKTCVRKGVKVYQGTATAKQKRRAYQLRKLYNMTIEQYDQILADQRGLCAICGTDKAGRGRLFYVDHDHVTGRVRGLVCNSCNRALGLFKDNLDILRSAVTYMEKHQ